MQQAHDQGDAKVPVLRTKDGKVDLKRTLCDLLNTTTTTTATTKKRRRSTSPSYENGVAERDGGDADQDKNEVRQAPLGVLPEPLYAQESEASHNVYSRSAVVVQDDMVRSGVSARAPATPRAKWKLIRVVSGHQGWVRALSVDPGNQWFASGASDRLIKIWDLASGDLMITLTGHISAVRALKVSERHPYLFSAGEDKMVKNWDLETNKVIRHYHGHLSGVYTLDLHPSIDILATGGRDSSARVWDVRTKTMVSVLQQHSSTIASVMFQRGSEYQLVSSGFDSLICFWDLRMMRCMHTLTHHKKSVRALTSIKSGARRYTFASGDATGSLKLWNVRTSAPSDTKVKLLRNAYPGATGIINCLACNDDGLLACGTDSGNLHFYDAESACLTSTNECVAQPGSLEAEKGVFSVTFDQTGTRLITGEADKTIKYWAETDQMEEYDQTNIELLQHPLLRPRY